MAFPHYNWLTLSVLWSSLLSSFWTSVLWFWQKSEKEGEPNDFWAEMKDNMLGSTIRKKHDNAMRLLLKKTL